MAFDSNQIELVMLNNCPHPLLGDATFWCCNRLDPGPKLIGVVPDIEALSLQIIDLDSADPIADVRSLIALPEWEMVVVNFSGATGRCDFASAKVTHAVDRHGHSCTQFSIDHDLAVPPRGLITRLDAACRRVLQIDACVV